MKPSIEQFNKRLIKLRKEHDKLIAKKNKPEKKEGNGIYQRCKRPVLTASHAPLHWRYDLKDPSKVIARLGGHFMAPEGEERVGDVSNVLFTNGWIRNEKDEVFIYYGSSDTRMHVATTSVEQLIDYCLNTPEDGFRSAASVQTINCLIDKNVELY